MSTITQDQLRGLLDPAQPRTIVSCYDLYEAFPEQWSGCCDSCHEDEQYGYDLCEREYEFGAQTLLAIVCCRVDRTLLRD